jgi:hypothetical protein
VHAASGAIHDAHAVRPLRCIENVLRSADVDVPVRLLAQIHEAKRRGQVIDPLASFRQTIDEGFVGNAADVYVDAQFAQFVVEDSRLVVERDDFAPLMRESATQRASRESCSSSHKCFHTAP